MIIAFEGIEGTGKGTQLKLLKNALEKEGFDILAINEPGGTPTGQSIREILLDKWELNMQGITEAFLFSASRAEQVRTVVRPALKEEKIILSDRSFYTMYAYQGYAREGDMEVMKKLTELAIGDTKPNYVILLDADPKIGLERKMAKKEINRLDQESLEFYNKAREGYLKMANENKNSWLVVDASQPIESVHTKILKHMLEILS